MSTNLQQSIERSKNRLSGGPYGIEEVFRPDSYDWPGDWEGRALLAFACHKQMNNEIPCMKAMLACFPEKIGEKGYFGRSFDENAIDEQQLSGHNWLLRGLLEAEKAGEESAGVFADKLVENLYIPALGFYDSYPIEGRSLAGGVSGTGGARMGRWALSTDVGCAFMPLDGLSEYYKRTKNERLGTLLKAAVAKFSSLDFVGLKIQTHATLSALRGVLTLYEATKDEFYLEIVLRIFALYVQEGMTQTFENYNWFGRKDTWTEPCAVVDSMILAIRLYRLTGEEYYKRLARRIRFNGLVFCQRENGGAGPNTCVCEGQPELRVSMYEAPFCCTMRYAEGLLWIKQNEALFDEENVEISFDGSRYFRGDKLLVKDMVGTFSTLEHFQCGNMELIELPSLLDMDEEKALSVRLQVCF